MTIFGERISVKHGGWRGRLNSNTNVSSLGNWQTNHPITPEDDSSPSANVKLHIDELGSNQTPHWFQVPKVSRLHNKTFPSSETDATIRPAALIPTLRTKLSCSRRGSPICDLFLRPTPIPCYRTNCASLSVRRY